LRSGQPALGTLLYSPGPELAELVGNVGLDYFMADTMGASIDWGDLASGFPVGKPRWLG
jgi:2-keto-3-deoxy-L-rhamnonate aldolase RhmA